MLLSTSGLEVLVDGYNVTLRHWPDLALVEQRHRLESGATALVARHGASITLVFDGDGDGGRPARTAPASVKVRFTAAEREADDEILELVASLPPEVPVLVFR